MGSYTCAMMSFGYCDFSPQPHFQALSRENRYRASWSSHKFQEKFSRSSSLSSPSPASKPNPKRMTWSPSVAAAAEAERNTTAEATVSASKRMSWAGAGSAALNKRTSWLPTSSSSAAPSTSSPLVPNKRITAPRATPNKKTSDKKDKSRLNGYLERVKSLGKKNKRDRKNYRQLDGASASMISMDLYHNGPRGRND